MGMTGRTNLERTVEADLLECGQERKCRELGRDQPRNTSRFLAGKAR